MPAIPADRLDYPILSLPIDPIAFCLKKLYNKYGGAYA